VLVFTLRIPVFFHNQELFFRHDPCFAFINQFFQLMIQSLIHLQFKSYQSFLQPHFYIISIEIQCFPKALLGAQNYDYRVNENLGSFIFLEKLLFSKLPPSFHIL
jgi:hypothetical protein